MKLTTLKVEVGIDSRNYVKRGDDPQARVWFGWLTGERSHFIVFFFLYAVIARRGYVLR